MAPTRQTSLGSLARLTDTLLFKIFSHFEPRDLLRSCSRVSWLFFVIHNAEELWRRLVLLYCIDSKTKLASFTFKGSWKATMLMPARLSGGAEVSSAALWKQQNIKDVQRTMAARLRACSGDEVADPATALLPALTTSSDINNVLQSGFVMMPPPYAKVRQKDAFKWYNVRGLDLMRLPMCIGGVDRRHKLSVEEFREQYERPNRPVLITGIIDHWRARESWKLDNFVPRYADVPFKTNGRSTNGRRFRMKLFDFMSYCAGWNGEKPLYIFDKKIFQGHPELLEDYEVPPHFREDLFEEMSEEDRPDYRWILIGPNGSGSPLHTDPHNSSAWNAVIEGCKRVTFYPPEVIPPGVDEELIHSDYYASDDTMDWYRNTLPHLGRDERPFEVLVFPGEVLFIPSGWWHTVQNIGHTIAVTQNFCSTITFPRVAADMNAHGGRTIRKDFKRALRASKLYAHLAAEIDTSRRKRKGTSSSSDDSSSSSSSSDSDGSGASKE